MLVGTRGHGAARRRIALLQRHVLRAAVRDLHKDRRRRPDVENPRQTFHENKFPNYRQLGEALCKEIKDRKLCKRDALAFMQDELL